MVHSRLMPFVYKITADSIVLLHFLWILFLIFGALISYRIRWLVWLHLGGLGFSILLQVYSAICPLTYLEVWLHERHDPLLTYPGSFITHYAEKLVYLQVDSDLLFWMTISVIFINLVIYSMVDGIIKNFGFRRPR